MTLYDDGIVIVHALGGGSHGGVGGVTIDDLTCTHFRAMTGESHDALLHVSTTSTSMSSTSPSIPTSPRVVPDGAAGRVLMMNSATTLDMLSEYHRTLLNHQAYAESSGYGYVLALVKTSALRGRSGKFAKHLAMGMQAAQTFIPGRAEAGATWNSVCHMDLDAWHASWQPFSVYAERWSPEKDLLFGDTGQIWLNSGLMCARPTKWTVEFTQRVVNAVFSGTTAEDTVGQVAEAKAGRALVGGGSGEKNGGGGAAAVSYGFKRDQPAVWHVLSQTWAAENGMPYKAQACEAWHHACNPDENPIECWHWCHWDALQRTPPPGTGTGTWTGTKRGAWGGLDDINRLLSHVQLAPRHSGVSGGTQGGRGGGGNTVGRRTGPGVNDAASSSQSQSHSPPPLHRMCLRSCHSVLSRGAMGACSLLTRGASFCWPTDVDKMSLCDGRGCLAQMTDGGGGWIKHTGHQHWRDVLPSCVPTTEEEARMEHVNHLALCRASK